MIKTLERNNIPAEGEPIQLIDEFVQGDQQVHLIENNIDMATHHRALKSLENQMVACTPLARQHCRESFIPTEGSIAEILLECDGINIAQIVPIWPLASSCGLMERYASAIERIIELFAHYNVRADRLSCSDTLSQTILVYFSVYQAEIDIRDIHVAIAEVFRPFCTAECLRAVDADLEITDPASNSSSPRSETTLSTTPPSPRLLLASLSQLRRESQRENREGDTSTPKTESSFKKL